MPSTKHSMELSSEENQFIHIKIRKPQDVKNDILSGITVSLALVPEAIAFSNSRVWDHSGIEALQNITERYGQNNTKCHLLNLSKECRTILGKAGNIVELSVIEDLEWHIADDSLE